MVARYEAQSSGDLGVVLLNSRGFAVSSGVKNIAEKIVKDSRSPASASVNPVFARHTV